MCLDSFIYIARISILAVGTISSIDLFIYYVAQVTELVDINDLFEDTLFWSFSKLIGFHIT